MNWAHCSDGDCSKIHTVNVFLTRRGVPIPATEAATRQKAFEEMLNKDFLLAHSLRLGLNYRDFTDDQWRDVIRISGVRALCIDLRARLPRKGLSINI